MKIQLDLPNELNKKLKILKAKLDHRNLQQTIVYILEGKYNPKIEDKLEETYK